MKITPYILKWCLTTLHTFSVQKEWLAEWSVKWVILSWQASVRTCGVGRDSDLVLQPRADILLHKIRMCGRLGKISKFSPASATLWLLCYRGKAASETWSGVSGRRTQQKKCSCFQYRLLQELYFWIMYIPVHDRSYLKLYSHLYWSFPRNISGGNWPSLFFFSMQNISLSPWLSVLEF